MVASGWRRVRDWHYWLGLAILAPLLFWMGTALVFSLWPMRSVRGTSRSTGAAPAMVPLRAGMQPPPHLVEGARSVTILAVEGHPVAVADRGDATAVWDLDAGLDLGPVLPLDWVRQTAKRDFSAPFEEEAVYLYERTGTGNRLVGRGPETRPLPSEYTGPRPVYAFHLHTGSTHLYVDALTGELRARRNRVWRFYDLAFRLHSFEFTRDDVKRSVTGLAIALWLVLGGTGLAMAARRKRIR